MLRLAIVSDTHMPRGERRVPEPCVEALRDADLIAHAGDFSGAEVLEWLESLGPPVQAVRGNVESAEIRERLPETLVFSAGDKRFGMIHDAGPAKGRLERMRLRFPETDAVIFGHSHLPLHEESAGFQIFNPGSPTERRRAPRRSFGLAEVDGSSLRFCHVWI